ncbi:MAG: SAM-dependent chlorinase/fluorinase [Conexivisphaerales archaeon]
MIGILTDFGEEDHYVFQMKSVIKGINPEAEIYDITHSVEKYDIWDGSFLLQQATKFVPAGTILIGVVDPGVATSRKAIAIKTGTCTLIGPDNGLLYEAANSNRIEEVRQITSEKIILRRGSTFDGRDVFAPAAAHLSLGLDFSEIGPKVSRIEKFTFPAPDYFRSRINATVLHVDHFGNAILNVIGKDFRSWARGKKEFYIRVANTEWMARLSPSYAEMKDLGLVEGSTGYMEISSYRKGAPKEMHKGETVIILK